MTRILFWIVLIALIGLAVRAKLKKMSSNTVLKVWVTGDNDGSLRVLPARGLKVYAAGGGSYTVPKGANVSTKSGTTVQRGGFGVSGGSKSGGS